MIVTFVVTELQSRYLREVMWEKPKQRFLHHS